QAGMPHVPVPRTVPGPDGHVVQEHAIARRDAVRRDDRALDAVHFHGAEHLPGEAVGPGDHGLHAYARLRQHGHAHAREHVAAPVLSPFTTAFAEGVAEDHVEAVAV